MSGHAYQFHRVPLSDTGIGQSLGYESDAAFLESQREEEAKLDPEVRAALLAHRNATMRTILGV